jgi:hypothetical protein
MTPLEIARAFAQRKREGQAAGFLSQPEGEGLLSHNSLLSPHESSENGQKTPYADCEKSERSERSPDLEERPAIIEDGAGVPRHWAEGFAALIAMPPPAGFTPERWQRIVDAAGVFLDRWAAQAARCGWTDLDVFGVNPDRPDVRFDAMGLVLLLDRCQVVGIDQRGADLMMKTGDRLRYRRRPLPADTIPLWELAS